MTSSVARLPVRLSDFRRDGLTLGHRAGSPNVAPDWRHWTSIQPYLSLLALLRLKTSEGYDHGVNVRVVWCSWATRSSTFTMSCQRLVYGICLIRRTPHRKTDINLLRRSGLTILGATSIRSEWSLTGRSLMASSRNLCYCAGYWYFTVNLATISLAVLTSYKRGRISCACISGLA